MISCNGDYLYVIKEMKLLDTEDLIK